MSSIVSYNGKLKEILPTEDKSLEDIAIEILNTEFGGRSRNYKDENPTFELYDRFPNKYVPVKWRLFKIIEWKDGNIYSDLFEWKKSDDGTIDFNVRYYDGWCWFDESIGYVLDNVEKND